MTNDQKIIFNVDFFFFHVKSLLQEKITQLESASAEQEKENSEKLETLHKQIQEVKGQLKSSQDKVEKLKCSVNDKSEKMTQLQQKITQLEVDVQGKVSLW